MAYPSDENGTQVDWQTGDDAPTYWSNGTVTAENDGTWEDYWKLGKEKGGVSVAEVYPYYMVKFNDDWSPGSKGPWTITYVDSFSINDFERGDSMTISIIHIPSSQTIFSKDVVVS
jgi:hypothetical protein